MAAAHRPGTVVGGLSGDQRAARRGGADRRAGLVAAGRAGPGDGPPGAAAAGPSRPGRSGRVAPRRVGAAGGGRRRVERVLASLADDRLLTVADPGGPVRQSDFEHLDLVYRLAVSPDGRYLATAGSDRLVHVWDTRTGERRAPDPYLSDDDTVLAPAFTGDGRTLATVGREGRLRLWDPARPNAPVVTLTGPAQALNGLAFLPDGRALVGGDDGAAPLWSLVPEAAVARACAVLRAPLPPEEWGRLVPTVAYRPDCG
ncbi:hypothetical protein CG736_25330 [Kitasatospora sp. CB02891]|nr:hypothetical protein CG736_25330 [Kitasatospora sp. CB02891]